MYNSFFKLYIPIILFIIFISFFILIINTSDSLNSEISKFYWPLPGNKNITSQFGKRTSPTTGASTYHSGIDIAATENTPIYACFSGQVIFTGFKGAGGYTITIKNGDLESSYCHVSPKYIFKTGDFVTQKNILAYVGPKNVYGVINNPYTDSIGNPTNRRYHPVHICI